MHEELNGKIEQAQQGIARYHKIDAMLYQLKQEQAELKSKRDKLKGMLDKEDWDVEKLEGGSLLSAFFSLLGTKNKHLDKERAEAVAAKLKFDQADRDLQDSSKKIAELTLERAGYIDCQREYDQLYEQKKEQLLQESGEAAHKLLELTSSINSAVINQKEIKEAITAGNKVLKSLNTALDSLHSAEGWGTWDLLGGGFFSGIEKHSHIDDAKSESERTQKLLRNFRTELADIHINSDIDIQIDGFTKFADFFFDGLIADWCVQSKIHDSQNSVENVKEQVIDVLDKLNAMSVKGNNNIEVWNKEIQAIVEGT